MATGWGIDRSRAVWWTFGAVLGAVVVFVLHRFVGTLVFGVFFYYATRPVYDRLKHRIHQQSVAAAVALLALVGPALLLVGYTVAIGVQELEKFANTLREYARTNGVGEVPAAIEPYLELSEVVSDPGQLLTGGGVEAATAVLVASVTYLGQLGLFLLHLFVMVAVAFYLLRDDEKFVRWFKNRFHDESGVLEEYLRAVDQDFNNIFFGNILNAVITGTIGAISYSVLNLFAPAGVAVPYAALVGLLAGVASLIPVVGMKIVYVPVGVYLFALPLATGRPTATWFPVAFAAISFVVVDTIPDLVLRPYVSGRNLHMGSLMLAYVLGPLLFGWYGLFLAPMLLVLVVHFAKIILPELLNGKPIQPYAVDPTYLVDEPRAPAADAADPAASPESAGADPDGAATADSGGAADEPADGSEDRTTTGGAPTDPPPE